MKNIDTKGFFIIIITICLCTAVLGTIVSASGELYVNPYGETISGIKDQFAVGSNGTVSSLGASDVWAVTATGLERIGISEQGGQVPFRPPVTPPSGTINVKASVIRVGLDYYYSSGRNSSLSEARLQNYVGSGFSFGYYDSGRNFIEVGSTADSALTIVTDRNTSVTAGTIGCFHVKLPGSYTNFSDASAAASAYNGGFPAYYDGTYYALVGHYESADAAQNAISSGIPGEAFSASNSCVVVTRTNTTQILFEFDCGRTYSLAVHPNCENGKAITKYNNGYRYYGDFQFTRTTGENMTVVNILPLEDYVKGVVPYEMSPSWPLEALKAQACCARTYVMSNLNSYASCGFDVTDDTYSQAYLGTNSANATTDRAVDETAGLFVTYNGKLCETLYFSSDGGATEDSENIFTTAIPYLRGVIDPFESEISFTNQSWKETLTPEQLAARLRSKGYSISTIASVEPEYTRIGNMAKITFRDINGKSITVTKTNCYSVLNLKSIHFTIEESNGSYVIEGGGWGHNVGMSQWGAYAMASVHGYSYAEILGFYYTDITISKGILS